MPKTNIHIEYVATPDSNAHPYSCFPDLLNFAENASADEEWAAPRAEKKVYM